MKPIEGLKAWWQRKTGEEETPFDGDAPVWVISMLFHLGLMIVLAFVVVTEDKDKNVVSVVSTPTEDVEELEVPEEVQFSDLPADQVGAMSEDGVEVAASYAPVVADVSVQEPLEVDVEPSDINNFDVDLSHISATGLQQDDTIVKGASGQGTTGASGAVDRLTEEILLSLENRDTLVVWLFDQSASLSRQRKEIHERLDRIYRELGVLEAAGNEAFAEHDLLTSVVAFGNRVTPMTKKPTRNIAEIKQAISDIQMDDTGMERVFTAISMVADNFKNYRYLNPSTNQPERNVMIVTFTDEAGDDAADQLGPGKYRLDATIDLCKRYSMPVYVVGVPAPFGRKETFVKWVDPDPEYDQTPQWGRVDQGPESLFPERIRLTFMGQSDQGTESIDSGFGPYALSRLTHETGGIYFAVHPNRNVHRTVSRRETAAFSAHLEQFFDPRIMRAYRPDYVSVGEYLRRVNESKSRQALMNAAKASWASPMEEPRLRFEKRDEASFGTALSEAQKQAAKLEPKMDQLYELLKLGETDRDQEASPRWQAGYDLAMGRVMANKIRTTAYNAMLAQAKRGMKFKDPKNNVWVLKPSDEVSTGSTDAKTAKKAREYLERVVADHPDTPWAMLAQKELSIPLGWEWTEDYVAPPAPRMANPGVGNAAPAPANNAPNMLARPPKKRRPPKL